jgi:Tol biopolymer transport system component
MSETISPGTIIGQYSIVSKIGEGGMGEVYRARDTKLGRDVAIKVLPAAFSENSDRLRRFEQEARAAGALNHPNILVIFHIGTHDGAPYIVSELLEGETLRERLSGAVLPQRKALDYALQTARGLAAAHDKGIVHRDIKPDNVFITNDGRVKILDFGLAKLTGASDGTPSKTEVPTRRFDTDPGTVMGTMGYMSPEQLRGQPADDRSDIFSFGAMLYEMLSGRRAFRGESMADTMSAILREDPPDLSESNQTVSPALERLVHHCLEKNPAERFHSAGDLAFAIENLSGSASSYGQNLTPQAVTTATDNRHTAAGISGFFGNARAAWVVASLLFIGLIALLPFALVRFRQAPPAEAVAVRFIIAAPENTTRLDSPVISPDGRNLLILAGAGSSGGFFLRPLGSLTAQLLPGTESASGFPFWSPDSRSIAFRADGKLKKLDLAGRAPQTLCNMPSGVGSLVEGGSWNRDGIILFTFGGRIFSVPAAGGEPRLVLGSDQLSLQAVYRWPAFLPDARHFLYLMTPTQGASEIFLASLDGKETTRLLAADSNALYATSATGSGNLLFARDGALMAQPFDAVGLKLTGEPFVVADKVAVNNFSRGLFSVSDNGSLVYDPTSNFDNQQLIFVDRAGKLLEPVGPPGVLEAPRLSPDGKRVAVGRRDPQTRTQDIYVVDLARGTSSRLTFDPGDDRFPIWSPDGSRIVWESNREGAFQIYQKLASGVGQEELLLKSDVPMLPRSWSADGRFILCTRNDPKTKTDQWVLPLEGDRRPFLFLQTPFVDNSGRFSPDGRWISYHSDDQGRFEVYVQTFPASGGKWQVSTNGGLLADWRSDGKELFYISGEQKMMSVEVKPGSNFEAGVPQELFDLAPLQLVGLTGYDVTADGKRFLFVSRGKETANLQYTVVVNWTPEAKK